MSPRKDITPSKLVGREPSVRVFVEGGRVKVSWYEHGRVRYRTRLDTPAMRKEARDFALGRFIRMTDGPPEADDVVKLSTRQLWARYEASQFDSLAPNTRRLYAHRWRKWELFTGADTIAEAISTAHVDEFRQAMVKLHPVNQVRSFIRVVKIVYNWADQLELVQRNRVTRYRFKSSKTEVKNEPAEFTADEWLSILRELGGGQDGRKWKAWAAMMIAGRQGERINAILSLRWEHVDLVAGSFFWAKETNKQGRDRWQPMTWEGYAAILTAKYWADRRANLPQLSFAERRPVGAFVLPDASRTGATPYSYQAFYKLFRLAETQAGIEHQYLRAAHGARKMAAGDVAEFTGDALQGLRWIGDTDPRRAKEYIKQRDAQLERIANELPHHRHTAGEGSE